MGSVNRLFLGNSEKLASCHFSRRHHKKRGFMMAYISIAYAIDMAIRPCIAGASKGFSRLPAICFALSFMLLGGCGHSSDDGGGIRVGLSQLPMSLDPRYATDAASHRVQEFLHRGLTHLDEKFLPRPDLAESWQHPDPLTWEFTLKRGVRFHDGSMVRAADVAATLNAVLDQAMASPLRAGLAAISRIEVLADNQIRIVLNKPDASLLTRLAIGIVPASIAGQKHAPRNIIGCGPYCLLSWQGNQLEIEPIDVSGGASRIRFIGVKDPVTRSLKLVRGELDFTQGELPPHLLPYLQRQDGEETCLNCR